MVAFWVTVWVLILVQVAIGVLVTYVYYGDEGDERTTEQVVANG